MKKAAQIFMILGMMFGLNIIISIAVGMLLYPHVAKAEKKSDVSLGVKISILVFVSPVAGIILFFMKDEDFEKDNINAKKTVLAIIGVVVALVLLLTFLVSPDNILNKSVSYNIFFAETYSINIVNIFKNFNNFHKT